MGVNGIYGLSGSGLDVESLVKVGMLSKQKSYDKLYKSEVKQEWEKEIFSGLYTDLNTFKYSTLSDYKMQSNMSAMKAATSNDQTVTATANGAAVAMAHKVKVTSLSSNAYLLSNDKIDRVGVDADGKVISDSIRLKDSLFSEIKEEDGKIKYKLAGDTDYTEVDRDAVAVSFVIKGDDKTLEEDEKKKQTVSYTFADLLNGKTFNDLAADVNGTGSGVQASYDTATDTFSFYNATSGSEGKISFELAGADAGGTFGAQLLSNLKLQQSQDGELVGETLAFTAGTEQGIAGSNGEVVIDGKTYTDIKDNRVTVSGVTYNLLNVSEKDTDGSYKPTTVTVTQDTDTIIDYVKKFVEDYNKTLDNLREKYDTKNWNADDLEADYEPLTKQEQASMTAEQVEKWNTKAKAGLLYHNSTIGNIIDAMRDAIANPVQSVNSKYNSAYAIGITESDNKGHLTLDTDKLKEALSADADCVYQIFANDQDNYYYADANKKQEYMLKDDYNNRGIINRLYYNAMTDGISNIEDYAGVTSDPNDQSTLGLAIQGLKDKMTDFKTMMDAYQSKLYNKYDAMEVMISRMSSMYNTIFGTGQ
ncbi:MAG: flagellar filament capping protein FliD [Schwartzia sp.]|nr:flagellar filament capping protein FliD [Schwartzia sp. (in: firmicutes)]